MGFGTGAIARRVRAFVKDTRAGATAIASAAVTVMTVGGAALIVDHVWLYDQRDVLKTAAEAASIAATLDIDRQLAKDSRISDADLKTALEPVARRYVLVNLAHLAPKRFKRARKTLEVALDLDRSQRTVGVTARADLGGTLFSRNLPLLGSYTGPEKVAASAGVESESAPVEVVLAIDISTSMSSPWSGSTRMEVVKRAAKHLVGILKPSAHNRVAIGVVPWHGTVRLDASTAREWTRRGWARYPSRRTYPVPYRCEGSCTVEPQPVVDTLPASPPQAWRGCFDGHRLAGRRGGGVARLPNPTPTALFVSPDVRNPFAQSYFPPGVGTSYRCLDASDRPAGVARHHNRCWEEHEKPRHGQGDECIVRSAAMAPLSTERAAIERIVDTIAAKGVSTYSTLGVLWAQRMLEPAWKGVWGGSGIHPADPSTPEHAKIRKAIVLLTDGADSYCSNGTPDCADSPLAVSRTEACTAAKSRGTEIFVVAAMRPTDVSGALGQSLRACSSQTDQEHPQGTRRPGVTYVFLNNSTPEALEAAFADIASQLRTLRKVS